MSVTMEMICNISHPVSVEFIVVRPEKRRWR